MKTILVIVIVLLLMRGNDVIAKKLKSLFRKIIYNKYLLIISIVIAYIFISYLIDVKENKKISEKLFRDEPSTEFYDIKIHE